MFRRQIIGSSQSIRPKINTITVTRKMNHESVRGTYLSLRCWNRQQHAARLESAEQRQKVSTLTVKITLRFGLKQKRSLVLTLSLTLTALLTKRSEMNK
ncbi:hypothetical protein M9H77_31984 [Catharanthus roseus]|uniref:Uncharacterized protein n=1 Tax=Catharanthus roseus TaxID=4058 RepID=A0ACC0A4A5_CATRO|nr:hypothetical protein M9H77_31984 [Catharanthus roseus]